MRAAVVLIVLLAAAVPARGAAPPAKEAAPAARSIGASTEKAGARDVAVTVYNENLGVVKDRRSFSVASGLSDLHFADVAASIDPTSVHLRPVGGKPLEILWQDFRFDLVSTDKLLQRYVDQPVEVSTKDDQVRRGTLLSFDPAALVLLDGSGGLSLVSRGEVRQVALKELPKGLITRPTLVWRLRSATAETAPLELSYMAGGMGWHAEYVAVVDEKASSLDLQGWASIENRSGATFEDAALKLVAGTVHRAPMPRPMVRGGAEDQVFAMGKAIQERGFFEYHLYEVPDRATLANNEVKQIGLLHATGIRSSKKFAVDAATDPERVQVTVEFENAAAAGLGLPLPEGVVRVFQRDRDGSLELVGEDRIRHTARNETVRVAVGAAFDVAVERKQTDFRQISPRVTEASHEIILRNHKSEAIDVTLVEHAAGDWEILRSTIPSKKKSATTFEFTVRCPPEQPVTVAYTIRTRS